MVQVIVSKETAAQIMGLTEPCDLCDEDGQYLGRVTPVEPRVTLDEGDYSKITIPFSVQELDAARHEPTTSIAGLLTRFRSAESGQ